MMGAPWFKLYAADLLADSKVRLLTDEQLGQLVKLWCFACVDGSIPTDLAIARRLLGVCSSNDLAWAYQFFEVDVDDAAKMHSSRMMREQAEYHAKAVKLRENAKLGGIQKAKNRSSKCYENALANPAESEPEPEEDNNPLPLTRGRRSRKAGNPGLLPPVVVEAVNRIGRSTPKQDNQGRDIKVVPAVLAERLVEVFKENPWVTADVAHQAWTDYVGTNPEWMKAPHYFFGKKEHQKGGAHWLAFANMVIHRMERAKANPLPMGVPA